MKVAVTLFVVVMLVGCTTNATRETMNLGKENAGQRIKISRNDEILISLEANPTTGYTWAVSEIDTTVLQQQGQIAFEAESRRLGAPGKQTLRFQPISRGKTTLRLIYYRPWEKDKAPLDTFLVDIDVAK